ncbi:hypothetical protein HMPREF1983_00920 [Gemella bergeri ATCC 700627]|uniref:Uncharacterized protein n=1 Tax=Gemella bergeri ATCC 700627 TaxID=1321820 RepID=U2S4V2_9BACL|nr:hypothetical protein [Gemella bergeri]ERK57817.1 hypothetical protein HMPREF1983_00920 [Gemella bergeri ATCC 700627]
MTNKTTMPTAVRVLNAKSDITKFTEITARDYGLSAVEMTGIISQVLIEWQKRELIEVNDNFNKILKTLNEVESKEDNKDVKI